MSSATSEAVEAQPLFDRYVACLVLAAAGFGSMAVLVKKSYAAGFDKPSILAGRFAIASVLLWAIWAVRRDPAYRLPRGRAAALVAMGAIGYVAMSFCYYTAMQLLEAGTAALLLYTYPPMVAVLSWAFLGEKLVAAKLLAIVFALSGCVLVLGLPKAGAPIPLEGVAAALAAAAIYAGYLILGKRVGAGVPPILSTAIVCTSSATVYCGYAIAAGALHGPQDPIGWLWLSLLAVFSTVIAIIAFFTGISRVPASRAAIIGTSEPVITVSLAAIFLGEPLGLAQLAGGALIVAAMWVSHR